MTIGAFWKAFEGWCRDNGKPGDALAAPASLKDLEALRRILPAGTEEILKLVSIHNGTRYYLVGDGNFLSITEILEKSSSRSKLAAETLAPDAGIPETSGPVKPLWWSSAWIPFFKRNKEPVCIDLDPPV